MKTQDLEKAAQLAQDKKETRFLMGEAENDLRTARGAVVELKRDVSNGVPGARVELDAAKKHLGEVEARAKTLEERFLSLSTSSGELVKWDTQARSLAREHGLSEAQMETLFEQFKAGQSREQVQRAAQRLQAQEDAEQKPVFAFQGANDVNW